MLKKVRKSKGAKGEGQPVAEGTLPPPKPNEGCLLASMKAEINFLGALSRQCLKRTTGRTRTSKPSCMPVYGEVLFCDDRSQQALAYSLRNEIAGSTSAAFRAGNRAAAKAVSASTALTVTRVAGSWG